MYRDPTPEQLASGNSVIQKQLEITELSGYECFGEDANALASGFKTFESVIDHELPYSAIAAVPIEAYVIKKRYLYYYLDDISK